MRSSLKSTTLSSFPPVTPTTTRGLSQITSKVQPNGDPVEIFHHYTYAVSALYVPRLTSRGQLRFISESDFPVLIWCLFIRSLLSTSTTSSSKPFLRRKLRGPLERGLWVCALVAHHPPPRLHKGQKYTHPSMLAVKGRSCCSGLRAPAPVRSRHSVASFAE